MRAACLIPDHAHLVMGELEVDAPRGREVLIRTQAVGLCHSDLHVIDGTLVRPRPMVLGHEAVGVVEAVGPDVAGVVVGDRVVTCLVMPCGHCERCARGEPYLCAEPASTRRAPDEPPRLTMEGEPVAQMANVGALGEQILIDERGTVTVPESVPSELAAVLGCAIVTGLGSVRNVAGVQPGETVAVVGCGGIGLAIVQGARIAGAAEILAIDVSPAKLEVARRFGATTVLDASSQDVAALAADSVDHAFEAVGRPETIELAMALAAPGRRAYAVGVMGDSATLSVRGKDLRRAKQLTGVVMGATQPQRDIPEYVALWEAGRLDLASMVSDVLPLSAVNDGFAALARGEVTRAVVLI